MKKNELKIELRSEEMFPNGFSLKDFEKFFEENQNTIQNNRNIIKKLRLGEIETVTKSFKKPNFMQGMIYKFFRKTKAKRSFEHSLLLNQKGIKTPEPLCYIEVFDRFRLLQSYYISRQINYDFTLEFAAHKEAKDYKNILKSFIDFTYNLHKKNIMHLDYVVGNICVKKIDKGYDFFLVDLNRLYKGLVTSKTGVKNLKRISRDPEIIKILAEEYANKSSNSFSDFTYYLMKSVNQNLQRLKLKRFIKNIFARDYRIHRSSYVWDYYSNQPHVLNNKKLKRKIALMSWFANLKIITSSCYALFAGPYFYFKNKKFFERKIDSFGLCVNLDKPVGSQKFISNDELIEMIDELAINNILVRIPLADFDNIEKYIRFIKKLQDRDILVCILQDREHIEEKYLTKQRLDYIFSNLSNEVNTFQIGNSINRKKWAFVSIDEYFSFFKIAYDLKNNKFPNIKLLGSNIIDFDLPFFARSIFHFKSIFYDGIATQLYVDRRGGPEEKQLGFDTVSKIKAYSALARASRNTANELYITEVNWPLQGMRRWSPSAEYLIDESYQSRYMIRYYLLMLASGKVKKCYWHQLVAPGYGLVNNLDGEIKKRDAYFCLKCMVNMLSDGKIKKFIQEKNLYCLIVEKENFVIEAIWSIDKNNSFKSEPSQEILDIRGKILETKSSPFIEITDEVIYIKKQKNNYDEINLKSICRNN
ncbi:MAG: lipopolysaccharide kinase InaA family protein [Gammaproteobacteria bacterium]